MGHFTCKTVVTFLLVKEKLLDFAIVIPIRWYKGKKRKGYDAGFDDGFADSDYDSEEEE